MLVFLLIEFFRRTIERNSFVPLNTGRWHGILAALSEPPCFCGINESREKNSLILMTSDLEEHDTMSRVAPTGTILFLGVASFIW